MQLKFGDPDQIKQNKFNIAAHNLQDDIWHLLVRASSNGCLSYRNFGKIITDTVAEFTTEHGEVSDLGQFYEGVREAMKEWYTP